MTRWIACFGAAAAGIVLAGCGPIGQTPNGGPAPRPLRGTRISSQFDFATTHAVALTLTADKSLFKGRDVAGVEVRSADDTLVYQGAIRPGTPLPVHVTLPAKDKSATVTFRTHGVAQTATVALNANQASHAFH